MYRIVVLGLIVKLASVSGDCDVGKTIHDFDYNKLKGTWYNLYHPAGEEYDNLECPTDIYDIPVGDRSRLTTNGYLKTKGKVFEITGWVRDWNNTGYTQMYDVKSPWSGRCYILAVDYERYVIGKTCSLDSNKLLTYVAFRNAHPDNATMEDVKKALRDNDIDFNQLKDWNADRCVQLSVG